MNSKLISIESFSIEFATQKQGSVVLEKESQWPQFWDAFKNLIQDKNGVLILFDGDVGAGKTTSIGYLNQLLGAEAVASPSFAICHDYLGKSGVLIRHVDLYRVDSESDLESTGFWDLFSQPSVLLVEWAGKVDPRHWPLNWNKVSLRIDVTQEASHRRVTWSRF